MSIQPIITTTAETKKGNPYVKSNAGKYQAAITAAALVDVYLGAKVAQNMAALKASNPKMSSFRAFNHGVVNFFKNLHPIKRAKDLFKEVKKTKLKDIGKLFTNKFKALSPAKKGAIIVSGALILSALATDFVFNKISAHKADKNA